MNHIKVPNISYPNINTNNGYPPAAPISPINQVPNIYPNIRSDVPPNNTFEVGACGFVALYHFTQLPAPAEEAQIMHNMGARVHKFRLDPSHGESLSDFFKRDSATQFIMGLNFHTLVIWAMPNTGKTGPGSMFDRNDYNQNYKELYDLTTYLRTTYSNDRRFFLGNWETDNSLWGRCQTGTSNDPPPVPYKNVIDYFSYRQKAVNDAKAATPNSSIQVYHYAEVNCVQSAMKGYERVINKVIPYTNPIPDFISYSSYDSLWSETGTPINVMLPAALKYLSSILPPRSDGINRVFIGEFGFKESYWGAEGVATQINNVFTLSKNANNIMALYWAVYDNEGPKWWKILAH